MSQQTIEQFEIVNQQYLHCKSMLTNSIQLLQEMKREKPQNIRVYEQQELALRNELIRIEIDHRHNVRIFHENMKYYMFVVPK